MAWCRKPAVAAVVVAEAAAVAEAAVVAEAAAVVVAEPAVCRGVVAATAKPGHSPIELTNMDRLGRVRQSRPGQSMFYLYCCQHACVGKVSVLTS